MLGLTGCNHLSKEAREMTGNYYLTVASEELPAFELGKDGKCVVRRVEAGVVSFSVSGKWNVKDGCLVGELDPSTLEVDGDRSLVGNIPESFSFPITEANEVSMTIDRGGVSYTYHRRPQ